MPRKVLFMTNSDFGQSSVSVATAQAMLQLDRSIEVHIASQTNLSSSVVSPLEYQNAGLNLNGRCHFHQISGLSHWSATMRPRNKGSKTHSLPPGIINTTRSVLGLVSILHPWAPSEWIDIYHNVQRIYEEVKPDVTVIEPLLSPALSFAQHLGINWIVLAPNTLKEFVLPAQPRLQILWKYPIVCSGMVFPVPWYHIPLNIWFCLVAAFAIITDSNPRLIAKVVGEQLSPDIKLITMNELGLAAPPPEGLKILVANSQDIDFPLDVIPEYTIPCGPILRVAPSIALIDPELSAWLKRGSTIYMNLGTHQVYSLEKAKETAYAFRIFLDFARETGLADETRFQILWKMPRNGFYMDESGKYPKEFADILGKELESDQARITDWFEAEPKSILDSGHVICSVNHGGASSFNEALCSAVPQVLLPAWADCYDFACRAELLGFGVWGNKKAKGSWERKELAESLCKIVLGKEATTYKRNAVIVSKRHPESAGRDKAAREILQMAQ